MPFKLPYDENEAGAGSEEPEVRRRFVKKVLGYVSLQLAITAFFVASTLYADDAEKKKLEEMKIGCAGVMILVIVPVIMVVFWPYARHGCIGVTCIVAETFFLATQASCRSVTNSTENALFAAFVALIITLTFACISAYTNFDITKYRVFAFIFVSAGLVCFVILMILNSGTDKGAINMVMGIDGTLIFSVLLWYHMQTVIGGSVIAMRPDEVIFAMTQLDMTIVLIYDLILMLKLF